MNGNACDSSVPSAAPFPTHILPSAIAGALIAAMAWAGVVYTPYWQDDYALLSRARALSLAEQLLPAAGDSFWRPLGVVPYWELVAGPLEGSALAAHSISMMLFVGAVASMGWFAGAAARVIRPDGSMRMATFAATLAYGFHGAFFMPLAWASCAQELVALFFSGLFLRGVVVLWSPSPSRFEGVILFATPILLACALLSKEGPVMLPVLAVSLAILLGRPSFRKWALVGACWLVVVAAWLGVRSAMLSAPDTDSAYGMRIGINVLRNAAGLGAFSVGLTREVPRLLLGEWHLVAFIKGVVASLVFLALLAISIRQARRIVPARRLAGLGVFWLAGIAPYLPLGWNCYPYYALLALGAWPVLVGIAFLAAIDWKWHLITVICMAYLAKSLLMQAERLAPYPATLARAAAAESQLADLALQFGKSYAGRRDVIRVGVVAEDRPFFAAIGGAEGLSIRLGVPRANVQNPRDSNEDFPEPDVLVIAGDRELRLQPARPEM